MRNREGETTRTQVVNKPRYSCRIVAERKSAKQRCRKLAYGQRLARPTSLRGPPEKYSGCMVQSSGRGQLDRCVCGFGTCQGCQTDQCKWLANCKEWPARGALKAQEAFSLEDVQQEARRALVWLGFALNGHKNGTARRFHFWVRFGNLSFPKIVFFGGLVFGAAWRPLFWSHLAASFLYSFWQARLA